MYFRLDSELGLQAGYVAKKANKHRPLVNGSIVKESDLKLPWPFTIKPDPDEGFVMVDYYSSKNLMSQRLVDAIQSAGATNLQLFPAEITNTLTNGIVSDYLVVNIIGLVSCADSDASESSPLAAGRFFHKLVIDPTKTAGLLIFRLAESIIEIIVHEKVANAIKDADLNGIVLEAV